MFRSLVSLTTSNELGPGLSMANETTTRTATYSSTEADERRERMRNNVRRLREDRLLSKAELARRAGVSALTVDRIEAGKPCRMDTKRKIIHALGMTIEDREHVFPRAGEDNAGQT